MWHPEPALRHHVLPTRWPSAEEAAASRLFSPLSAGRLSLADRTWVPAMVPWRATDEGFVTDEVLEWYARFAEGEPGAIVVEATGVRDVPSGPLLRIGDDRFLPGLATLVDTVKRASAGRTRLFIQIIDFLAIRRRPPRDTYLSRYLQITPEHRRALGLDRIPDASLDADVRAWLMGLEDDRLRDVLSPRELEALEFGMRERVTDVDQAHIRDLPLRLPGIFAAAARRADTAGFDGVELHYAHAYTMASFLSARNTRTDGYGGPREQRVRLPLEVFRAARAAVSDRFLVGCRYLSDECIEAGNTVDDGVFFGVEFARAGMDFLSLSRGGKFEDAKQPKVGWAAYPYTGPSGWECMPTVLADEAGPFGRNVTPAARIRDAIRAAGFDTPVVAAGGIHTFDQAEAILASGAADIIGAARQSLADPDWFLKMRLGRGDEVRRCSYTNYCEGLDLMHKQVTCKLWDREQLDGADVPGGEGIESVRRSHDGKRRLLAPAWAGRPR
jgi:2,4-dienoyl-CoA reductase-like NADH-dependent reductase (Old Yellow Enzyme family)